MRKLAFALLAVFFAIGSYAQEDTQDMPDVQDVQNTKNIQNEQRNRKATDTQDAKDIQDEQDIQENQDNQEEKTDQKPRKAKKTQDDQADQTDQDTRKFSWGVKANINLASERNAPEDRSRTGFAAGFFAEVKLNNTLSFQPEILYSQQGSWQNLIAYSSTSGDKIMQYDYLNLPLLLKIYVWKRKLSIEVGPQIGYLLSHKTKNTPRNGTKRIETIDKDFMNKLDVAAAVGVSYKAYGPFDLFARYTYGFLNIYKKDTGIMSNKQQSYFIDDKNSVIQFGIAARF